MELHFFFILFSLWQASEMLVHNNWNKQFINTWRYLAISRKVFIESEVFMNFARILQLLTT